MKFVDEFRSPQGVDYYRAKIAKRCSQQWTIMEVCGSQTNTIVKYGLETLLPNTIELIHGPGCPVCVTPAGILDHAIALAATADFIVCSFGDMLRVPGSSNSLNRVRAQGGDVRTVYSPMDALQVARENPDKQIVMLAIGFETTAPLNATCVLQAQTEQLDNFSLLVSQVTVPPALIAILSQPKRNVDAFLAAGHVCTIMGEDEYRAIARRFSVPIVITGFEPVDIMAGIERCVAMLEQGQAECFNGYTRSVKSAGNNQAKKVLQQVFELADKEWRGIGIIPNSGLVLRQAYQHFDAALKFPVTAQKTRATNACISGEILQGLKKPHQCPHFGKPCNPENPMGATMVSSEGACAAYFKYNRLNADNIFAPSGDPVSADYER